jgi:putative zinc finger/helix-turn-helix YgiT family protein
MDPQMSTPVEVSEQVCQRCRKGPIVVAEADRTYAADGQTVGYKDIYMRCENCGREFYTSEQSAARQRAITAALRKNQGFMTGDEIRAARESYGLTLPEFERALAVGKNTVGRWERGTVPPASSANIGLWLAAKKPDVFEEYARLRGVEIKKRPAATVTAEAKTSVRPPAPFETKNLTPTASGRVPAWTDREVPLSRPYTGDFGT